MSFGKDPETQHALATTSFRQESGQFTQNNYPKKKGGGIPYFIDAYTPSTTDIDVVRLLPGQYLQESLIQKGDEVTKVQSIKTFIKFREHFDGTKRKGCLCSAGPFANFKDLREPCYGCDIFWETCARAPSGRLESARMSRQDKYAFSIFDYGVYHRMPQIDRMTGKIKTNSITKEPYYNWVKCQGQGCDACRAGIEMKRGHATHFPINYTQLQTLRSAEVKIGKFCTVCETQGSIISYGWECPACGEGAIDMSTTTLKMDELLKITDNAFNCPSCKTEVLLREVYECKTCTPRGKQGIRASLFDVDLNLSMVKDAANKNILQVMGWTAPHPIASEFQAQAKPLDLVARYAPDSLERQAERFGYTPKQAEHTNSETQARPYTNLYGNKPA